MAPQNQEPPKIQFPCEHYPIKVMGKAGQSYYNFVFSVLDDIAPTYDRERIGVKASRNGTYQSITVFITAESVDQLSDLHDTLRKNPETKIVL